MIKFEKVPYEQYREDRLNSFPLVSEKAIQEEYDNIKLPERATVDSAGYDFFLPFDINMMPKFTDSDGNIVYQYGLIPTGIRWICDRPDLVLLMFPRSGLGFKHGLRLANSTGVIDSHYFESDNYGHIMAKFNVEKALELKAGKAFLQGVMVPYFKTDDDNVTAIRNGGFGSTGK